MIGVANTQVNNVFYFKPNIMPVMVFFLLWLLSVPISLGHPKSCKSSRSRDQKSRSQRDITCA